VETSIQTPIKTLLYVVKLPTIENKANISDRTAYESYYLSLPDFNVLTTDNDFGTFSANVIFNNYEEFIKKVIHRILSI
jgi:hypothetical protein